MEEERYITGLEINETVRTELAGMIRWVRVQLIFGCVMQALMVAFSICYIRFYCNVHNMKPNVASEYLRMTIWTVLNIVAYIFIFVLVGRYLAAAREALTRNNQLKFQAMFRYMRKAAVISSGIMMFGICYHTWELVQTMKHFK